MSNRALINLGKQQKAIALANRLAKLNPKMSHEKYEWDIFTSGELFLQEMLEYGIDYYGEKLRINNWHKEYFEWLGSLWISKHLVTGAQQTGKTNACTMLNAWMLVRLRKNTIWAYSQETTKLTNVPRQWQPLIARYLEKLSLSSTKQQTSISLCKVNDRYASFVHATPPKPSRKGLAKAGGNVVGQDADVCFLEERSQFPPGTDAPIFNRTAASRISTRPSFILGTPGGGAGIEKEIKTAHRNFYPHCVCPSCQKEIKLSPKGCLLKPHKRVVNSKKQTVYLTESGAPISWFHKDPKKATDTAYFACPLCQSEIPREDRVSKSYFKCTLTNEKLKDFLQRKDDTTDWVSAIWLSPLLVDSSYNLASNIINEGLNTQDSENWQQQALGLVSESGQGSISLEMLQQAWRSPKPIKEPDFTLCGIDQGRHQMWMVVANIYLPDNWLEMEIRQVLRCAIREVVWAGDIVQGEIYDRLEDLQVNWGLIDNEPDIQSASNLAQDTGVLGLANQVSNQYEAYLFKEGKAIDAGIPHDVWSIRQEKYLKAVIAGFIDTAYDGQQLYRLPEDWVKWERQPVERSPLRHLMAVHYDPNSGKWERPADHIDDIYYCFHFLEAATEIYLIEQYAKGISQSWAYS